MNIGRAIYKILKDDTAVFATVETRISPNVMAQTSNFPFIIYDVSRDTPEGVKETTAPLDDYDIMVSCYAVDYKSASNLANYIRTALDRKSGNYAGVDIQSIDFDGYDDIFDDDSGSTGIYRKALNFKVRVINSLNNIYSTAFDGVDDYVRINDSASLITSSAGSISCWINLGNISASGHVFKTNVDSNNYIQLIHHYASNEMRFGYAGGGTAKTAVFTDNIRNDGNWHYVSATWSVGDDEIKIYLDGVLKATTSSLGTYSGTNSSAGIGWNLASSGYFLGNIDEFALFNTTLTATQIKTFYNDGYPTSLAGETGLIGYWKMGDGATAPNIPDDSSNNNTALMVNMSAADFEANVPDG